MVGPARLVLIVLLIASGLSAALGQTQKWKFIVFGDCRGLGTTNLVNTNIVMELARACTNEQPAFVLVSGDLIYQGDLGGYQTWSNAMRSVYQAGIPVYPVRGNHDLDGDASAYPQFFAASLPQNGPTGEKGLTYAIYHSNAVVLALDAYVKRHQVNTNWVKAVLATNTCLHVFAMSHDPAFKVTQLACLDDYPAARDTFWNLLSNAACRVYLTAHDHYYDHLRADDQDGDPSNDVHQFIIGTGGGPFSPDGAYDGTNDLWTPVPVYHEKQYGYGAVEIDGPTATLTWHHRVAPDSYPATSEVFTYSLAPVIAPVYSNGSLTLSWSGGGRLQSAATLGGPWTTLANGTSPYRITDFSSSTALYFRVKLR